MRWQIELLFKTWKSTLGIDKIQPMRRERLLCLMYAKLLLYLAAVQTTLMFSRFFYLGQGRLLSIQKCVKTFIDRFCKDRSALTMQKKELSREIKEMANLLSRNHWLEKRKGKVGFAELLELFICVSDN
jgi:hypothetical protein